MNAFRARVLVCALVVGLLAVPASATISIDTVTVGDPGNAADTTGYGSVGYTYNIGKYEVTAGQYNDFLNAVAATDTYGLYNIGMSNTTRGSGITQSGTSGNYTYSVAAAFVNRPVNYVSFWDACRFTNWLSNGQGNGDTETGTYTLSGYNGNDGRTIQRNANAKWAVASENEWYKAAYYKGGSTTAGYWAYPTRSNTAPGRDMGDASGNNANIYGTDASPIDSPYYTTVGGEFQNSASPYGTFDQAGNVWEWNESLVSGPYRGVRGGAFNYGSSYLTASYRRYDPLSEMGFRVSQVPEPASAALLAMGSLLLLGRRRRAGR